MEHRTMSLNLVSYLVYKGFEQYEIHEKNNGLYFFTFPECDELKSAIKEYKNLDKVLMVDLRAYTQIYADLRKKINGLRKMNDKNLTIENFHVHNDKYDIEDLTKEWDEYINGKKGE